MLTTNLHYKNVLSAKLTLKYNKNRQYITILIRENSGLIIPDPCLVYFHVSNPLLHAK